MRGPGIHTPDGGYGFRARRFAPPRNDEGFFQSGLGNADHPESAEESGFFGASDLARQQARLASRVRKKSITDLPDVGQISWSASGQIWIMDNIRPTSHAATAHPAPVKNPTQNQTPIRYTLTVEGILDSPESDDD
jgi:hypothetical protein